MGCSLIFRKFSLLFFFCFSLLYVQGQDTLSICSFNVQFLGHFQNRENNTIAEILKEHDIVVVQEMVAPPKSGVYPDGTTYKKDKESSDFVIAMQKNGFEYWLSEEDTGPNQNHTASTASEWWIVFYKRAIVSPDTIRFHGFVSKPLTANPIFERVPYAFPFISADGKSNFTLISVHLKPGEKAADKIVRQQELKQLIAWVSTATETNKDFYIVGDCNIYKPSEFISFKDKGICSLNEKCLSTNAKLYESVSKGKPYDHVFYSVKSTEELLLNSFQVIDLKNEIVKNSAPGEFILDPFNYEYFKTRFSDHLPVSFKLITGQDTDL